jgi:hypothetical protein
VPQERIDDIDRESFWTIDDKLTELILKESPSGPRQYSVRSSRIRVSVTESKG